MIGNARSCWRGAVVGVAVLAAALSVVPPPTARAQARGSGDADRVPAAYQATVGIYDDLFLPSELTVPVGTTITWTNRGRHRHTTTGIGTWASGTLAPGQSWTGVFATPGVFDYLCVLHPEAMAGRVTVLASPARPRAAVSPAATPTAPPATRATAPERDGAPAAAAAAAPPRAPEPAPAASIAAPLGGPDAASRCPEGARCAPGLTPSTLGPGEATGPPLAALAVLSPRLASGVAGEAAFLQTGDVTNVAIILRGLAPGVLYSGRIRAGRCEGPVVHVLDAVRADADGQGRVTAVVNAPLDARTWWIEYLAGEGAASRTAACGPVGGGG